MMGAIMWFGCGLLTAWLKYHSKETIPVVKAILITIFGFFSLIIWSLFNLGYEINNPMARKSVNMEIIGRIKEKTDKK